MSVELIASRIREVPDFPKPGVVFKDITPLLADAKAYHSAVDELVAVAPPAVDLVIALEARGFLFGAPVALALNAGFVPIRKSGKLPGETISESFELEYGSETLCLHRDSVPAGSRVLVVDDVLATGGTVVAAAKLLDRMSAELLQVSVLMELGFLNGRARLADSGITNVTSVLAA